MLERYYVKPTTVDRIRSSWLSEPIDKYVSWLVDKRYSVRSISRRIPLLVEFGEFARTHGADRAEVLPRHIEAFIDWRMSERGYRRKASDLRKEIAKEVRGPIEQMLACVVPGFEASGRARVPENAFEDIAPGFFPYLRQERGLREASIRGYSHYLRRFKSYLDSIDCRDLEHLSPPILSAFFLEYSKAVRWASVRDTCGILHVFFRYLYRERILGRDFSGAIERPHRCRHSNIPRSITWDEVRKMLDAVDRRTPMGKRDYALLLLLVTYGLRSREVAALTLDDIDWRNERLRVPERKAAHSTVYPLSAIVGQAIVEYLKLGRPQTDDRHVFFRSMAPVVPLTYAAISSTASHYLRKAGIAVSRPGSHTLRHTCVQRLVDADFSFKLIGDYVGHRSPASTQIYGKVAVEALREVALGDIEEVLR